MSKRAHETQSQVLAVLRSHRDPLSAYDVIGELRQVNPKIAPPTVYRALAALIDRGQVHRVESLNAFMACQCDRHQHASILAICDDCGTVEENFEPDLLDALSSVVAQSGFAPTRHVIELHGFCSSCGTGGISV